MSTRLIVGFDGSQHAHVALDWAAREAAVRQASVHVITAFASPPIMSYYGISSGVYSPNEYEPVADRYRNAAQAAVSAMVAQHPGVGFDLAVVDAYPAEALVREATPTDLIVVGASGAGSVKSFLLGSVVAAVLHRSPCPVVVAPATLHLETRRIAVGIDDSEHADAAVKWAADEAQRLSVDLVVAHAWEYPYRLTDEGSKRGIDIAEVDAGLLLERAVAEARERTTMAIEGRLLEGGAAQSLLDLSNDCDMLVVGSRGRGGLRSMVLGSVAISVAAHASAPVVVVH